MVQKQFSFTREKRAIYQKKWFFFAELEAFEMTEKTFIRSSQSLIHSLKTCHDLVF